MTKRKVHRVKNVVDYLNRITQIPRIVGANLMDVPINYRGESKKYPNIIASVFRYEDEEKGIISHNFENALIQKATLEYPQLFINCSSMLEKLVMMQHLSLPTRLIDVTSNPLVALYFACEKDFNEDGKVYYMQQEYTDYKLVEKLSMFLKLSTSSLVSQFIDCAEYNGMKFENKNSFIKYLFKIITKDFLFKSPYINDRIRNQRGSLIFSRLAEPDDISSYENFLENKEVGFPIENMFFNFSGSPIENMFDQMVITIPYKYKRSILKELEKYGIDEAFIYPDSEHQMKAVATYCKNVEHWKIDLGE